MKATYGEVKECQKSCIHLYPSEWKTGGCNGYCDQAISTGREIFKDPVTDSGEKKSAKGLLCVVDKTPAFAGPYNPEDYELELMQSCTKEQEQEGLLTTVFKDGKLVKKTSLEEIRKRLNG